MRNFVFRLSVFFQGAILTPSFQQLLVKRLQTQFFTIYVDSKGKRLGLSRAVVRFYASIKIYLQVAGRNFAPDYRLRNFTPADATRHFQWTMLHWNYTHKRLFYSITKFLDRIWH